MPILRVASALDESASAQATHTGLSSRQPEHAQCLASTSGPTSLGCANRVVGDLLLINTLLDLSYSGLLGSKVPQNVRFPDQDAE